MDILRAMGLVEKGIRREEWPEEDMYVTVIPDTEKLIITDNKRYRIDWNPSAEDLKALDWVVV